MRDSRLRRIIIATLGGALLAAAVPASVAAVDADESAWAVVRRPAAASYRISSPKDQHSTGGNVKVERLKRGVWEVMFKGVDGVGGTAHVTPLTAGGAFCVVREWFGKPLVVVIGCHNRNGGRTDVPFIVNFVRAHQARGQFAYLWADKPSAPEYAPHATYSWNADGAINKVTRFDTGRYRVVFTAGPSDGGHIQVSAYGTKHLCRTTGWDPISGDEVASIFCSDRHGSFADARFTVSFHQALGLRANSGGKWAYLLANKPQAASYVPQTLYRDADPTGRPRIRRTGKGRYEVTLPSMPLGGAVQVSAFNLRPYRCNVSGIRKTGKKQRIGVRCFNGDGTKPKDSFFTLSYTK